MKRERGVQKFVMEFEKVEFVSLLIKDWLINYLKLKR